MSVDIFYLHKSNLDKGLLPVTENLDIQSSFGKMSNQYKFLKHFYQIEVNSKNVNKFKDKNIGDITPYNIDELQMSIQSTYISATNEDSIITSQYIHDYYQFVVNKLKPGEVTITDACANIGANTINFALKFDLVNAIELVSDEYKKLVNNVDSYGFTNVSIFQGDAIQIIYERKTKQDIIFFDPPWGGADYIKYKKLGLSLSEKDITEDIESMIDLGLAKLVVLKGPSNTYLQNTKYYRSKLEFYNDKVQYKKGRLFEDTTKSFFNLYFFHKDGKPEQYIETLKEYTYESNINEKFLIHFSNVIENIPVRVVNIEEVKSDKYKTPVALVYNIGNQHYEPIVKYQETNDQITSIQSDIKYEDLDTNEMIKFSISTDSQFVNKEITRKEVYENIINEFYEYLIGEKIRIQEEDVIKMVNNYIFCKIITKKSYDEPLIISENSSYADKKLAYDLKYYETRERIEVPKKTKTEIIKKLQELFYTNSQILNTQNIISDGTVDYKDNSFIYRYTYPNYLTNEYYEENINIEVPQYFRNKFPELLLNYKYNYIACYLRYQYLNLKSIALAYDYANDKFTAAFDPESTLECFASVFNFHYRNWCSAFYDIENVFGSVGSFWELDLRYFMRFKNLVINPPFDQVIIEQTIDRIFAIIEFSKTHKNELATIFLVLPDWSDIKAIKNIKYQLTYTKIPKNSTYFIDYFQNEKVVQPCDILIFNIQLK